MINGSLALRLIGFQTQVHYLIVSFFKIIYLKSELFLHKLKQKERETFFLLRKFLLLDCFISV